MGLQTIGTVQTVEVYLTLRELHESCRPCHVWREGGITIVKVDPRETRLTITQWMVDTMTELEANYVRAAFGLPPVGCETPTWVSEDIPALLFIPPALRLPGEPPLQGGAELNRRYREGTMAEEIALYMAETSAAAQGA